MKMLKKEIADIITGKLGYMMIKPAIKSFRKKVDYSEYGGALLLGINGTSIICHGRSSAKAIKNAIKVAVEMAKKQIYKKILDNLNYSEEINESQNTVNGLLCSRENFNKP
jgi:glycerol-3-phosphate acyltransferase PlsX